jgi:uncharacterized protein with PIN domain
MGQPQMQVVLAPELRIFLRRGNREERLLVPCDGVSSLGHLVESLGVPLTEVGSLAVNGEGAGPGYRPRAGDVACVGPVRRPQLVDSARFLLDVHLGTVARRLRLVGLDTAYRPDADDDELIAQANADHRVLLTQDRGLLRRRKLWLGAYVKGADPESQFADVLDRFAPELAPWTRCPACNGLLAPVSKSEILAKLQPGTRRTYADFSRCQSCGQVYWRGAHATHLAALIASARRLVTRSRQPGWR